MIVNKVTHADVVDVDLINPKRKNGKFLGTEKSNLFFVRVDFGMDITVDNYSDKSLSNENGLNRIEDFLRSDEFRSMLQSISNLNPIK